MGAAYVPPGRLRRPCQQRGIGVAGSHPARPGKLTILANDPLAPSVSREQAPQPRLARSTVGKQLDLGLALLELPLQPAIAIGQRERTLPKHLVLALESGHPFF